MSGNRPRARLTGGGPTWELRTKPPRQQHPQPLVPEADALMALDEALVGIRLALVAKDFRRAWVLRSEAWRYADLLPPGKTRKQRRALGQYKVLLLAAQRVNRGSK